MSQSDSPGTGIVPFNLGERYTVGASDNASLHQYDAIFSQMGYRADDPESIKNPLVNLGKVQQNIGKMVMIWLYRIYSEKLWEQHCKASGLNYTTFLSWYENEVGPYLPEENVRPYFASLAKGVVTITLGASVIEASPVEIISSSANGAAIEMGKLHRPGLSDKELATVSADVLTQAGVDQSSAKLPARRAVQAIVHKTETIMQEAKILQYTYDGEVLHLRLPTGVTANAILAVLTGFGYSVVME